MIWWKKALIQTILLAIAVAALAVVLHHHIVKTSANAQIEDARDDKLGATCGQIYGVGLAIIWIVARRLRKSE
jgi:hypothetical protein